MSAADKNDLISRIAALSAAQRQQLAERLALRDQLNESRSQRLVAYYRPHDGQPVDGERLRRFARERLPDYMVPQLFVPLDELPRAPGGKVDRKALAGRALAGPVHSDAKLDPPRNESEAILAKIWCEVLGLDEVGVHESYFELGGDSLLSIRIISRARKAGLELSPETFFAHPTIAEQAACAKSPGQFRSPEATGGGTVPLTPIQHWFFERIMSRPEQWNQSLLLSVDEEVGPHRLKVALTELIRHHDGLRLRFQVQDGRWSQTVVAPSAPDMETHRLAGLAVPERQDAISEVARRLNEGFDLHGGSLISFAFFATEEGRPDFLLIVAHHLVVDAVSLRIIREDLEGLSRQLTTGPAARLSPESLPFKAWAENQAEMATAEGLSGDSAYWERQVPCESDVRLPRDFDHDSARNDLAGAERLSFELDADETTTLLQELPRRFRAQIREALISALARSLSAWTGRKSVVVDIEGHGRNTAAPGQDLSRTVGWLTVVFPFQIQLPSDNDSLDALQQVKQQLREVPNQGAGHGRLVYLAPHLALSERLSKAPRAEFCFNYLGQADLTDEAGGLLTPVSDRSGYERSAEGLRAYLIEVNAWIRNGCLTIDWEYHGEFHRQETIEALGQHQLRELRTLIAACRERSAPTTIPSDFPLANLDQGELDQLSKLLKKPGAEGG